MKRITPITAINLEVTQKFAKSNKSNLFTKVLESVDTSEKMAATIALGFRKAKLSTNLELFGTGVAGVYTVDGDGNIFSNYYGKRYDGIKISNCTGVYIIVSKKPNLSIHTKTEIMSITNLKKTATELNRFLELDPAIDINAEESVLTTLVTEAVGMLEPHEVSDLTPVTQKVVNGILAPEEVVPEPVADGAEAAPVEEEDEAKDEVKKVKKVTKHSRTGRKGPGVVATIAEIMGKTTKATAVTKKEVLEVLIAKFPERLEESMKNTVALHIPTMMSRERFTISKTLDSRYYKSSSLPNQPKERQAGQDLKDAAAAKKLAAAKLRAEKAQEKKRQVAADNAAATAKPQAVPEEVSEEEAAKKAERKAKMAKARAAKKAAKAKADKAAK